jgi:acid phosphatase
MAALALELLAFALLALPALALAQAAPAAANPSAGEAHASHAHAGVPRFDHVMVVIMENKSYDQTRAASYTAGLIAAGSSFSASSAVTHPSLPNYLALWSGSTEGVTDDACPPKGAPYPSENLGHACEAQGLTWRAYSEDLPSAGSTVCAGNGKLYTRKHDPWTYYSNLNHANERPYTDLASDIAAGRLPRLAFVIPNNCHNTHDEGACTVAVGDAWLAANLPAMIAAVGPRGVVILTWDEDDFTKVNRILTVMSGPLIRRGYVSTRAIDHYTVLRTIGDGLGLKPIGAAAHVAPITDVWRSGAHPQSPGGGGAHQQR